MTQLESFPNAIPDDGSFNSSRYEDEEGSMMSGAFRNSTVNRNNRRESGADLHVTLARPERMAVRVLRVFVLLAMVGAALAVSLSVYFMMKTDEETAHDQDFDDLSRRLLDGFMSNTRLSVQTMDMLALSFTSSVIDSNQTWPFVTLNDFEARATAARVICHSEYIGLYPYVNAENRLAWEDYTTELDNLAWMNKSFAYQEAFYQEHGRTVGSRAPTQSSRTRGRALEYDSYDEYDHRWLQDEATNGELDGDDKIDVNTVQNATFDGPEGITPEIYRYGSEEEGILFVVDDSPDHYYPMWQVSPIREYSYIDINYNSNDPNAPAAFAGATEISRTTQTAVFAGVWNVDEFGDVDENDDYDNRLVPAATLFYPVFDKIIGPDKQVVAVIDLDVEFGPLFTSVLPASSNRLVVVVENPCSQVYSYEVAGEVATYLGAEDLHDPKYDEMMAQTLLTNFATDTSGVEYNGAPMNKDFCPWVLSVYGTQEMEDAHITNQPLLFMFAVLGVFLFTCLVFILYDRLVEKRQQKVMTTAVNSEKVVASLFPKAFRERLYENNNATKANGKDSSSNNFQSKNVADFLSSEFRPENDNTWVTNSPPMAEAYPHCSVFFADIAGFTAWSSVRSPTEVFTLLETIYGAFDKLAKKHAVFKIETIGDCYVAVTGLPTAQPNHALLMVKFSKDVLIKMKKLTRELDSSLGPDTSTLAMRVGIHSGPVTAGILRGEKARFQLFGDAVNTAARMESNGVRDCIHVSQSTADELIALGKGQWVHARKDKITAKGKGLLQTYWVRPTGGTASVASTQISAVTDTDIPLTRKIDEVGDYDTMGSEFYSCSIQNRQELPPTETDEEHPLDQNISSSVGSGRIVYDEEVWV